MITGPQQPVSTCDEPYTTGYNVWEAYLIRTCDAIGRKTFCTTAWYCNPATPPGVMQPARPAQPNRSRR
jgi:hypothetical protein